MSQDRKGSGSSGESITRAIIPSNKSRKNSLLTTDRILNIFMIALFSFLIIAHVVCLVILKEKHDELVQKFRDGVANIENNCILFIDYENGQWKLVNNTSCDFVIHSSETLIACASFMIMFLVIRTALFRKWVALHLLLCMVATALEFTGFLSVRIDSE